MGIRLALYGDVNESARFDFDAIELARLDLDV